MGKPEAVGFLIGSIYPWYQFAKTLEAITKILNTIDPQLGELISLAFAHFLLALWCLMHFIIEMEKEEND